MGDCPTEPLRTQSDRGLRLRFVGAKVTSDAGLLAYRELDDALDLTRTAAGELRGHRTGQNTPYTATALLRQSVYSRLAGGQEGPVASVVRPERVLDDAEEVWAEPGRTPGLGSGRRSASRTNGSGICGVVSCGLRVRG
jgi:hypothetical protein